MAVGLADCGLPAARRLPQLAGTHPSWMRMICVPRRWARAGASAGCGGLGRRGAGRGHSQPLAARRRPARPARAAAARPRGSLRALCLKLDLKKESELKVRRGAVACDGPWRPSRGECVANGCWLPTSFCRASPSGALPAGPALCRDRWHCQRRRKLRGAKRAVRCRWTPRQRGGAFARLAFGPGPCNCTPAREIGRREQSALRPQFRHRAATPGGRRTQQRAQGRGT